MIYNAKKTYFDKKNADSIIDGKEYNYKHEKSYSIINANEELLLFDLIIKKASSLAKENNSELIFVYLPDWLSFVDSSYSVSDNRGLSYKKDVLEIVSKNHIKSIDLYPSFLSSNSPMSYFPDSQDRHYNGDGYKLVSNQIINYIKGRN